MPKLNRETVTAFLAFLILAFGVYQLIGTQTSRYAEIRVHLVPNDQEILPLEPALWVPSDAARRNPFLLTSEWKALAPEPLELPPPELERDVRVLFGWSAERAPGAPIERRTRPLVETKDETGADDDAAAADAGGGETP